MSFPSPEAPLVTYGPQAGALFALAAAFTWTVISLQARILSRALNPVAINAIRSSIGGVLLVGWVLLAGGAEKIGEMSAKEFVLLELSMLIAVGVGDTVFFESTRRAGFGRAMTIAMTYPLIAGLLAITFLGESITLRLAAGLLLTLGGLVMILSGRPTEALPASGYWSGIRAACLASVAWAVAVILLKPPLQHVDPLTAQVVRLPVAGAILWATPWARGGVVTLKRSGRALCLQMAGLGALTAVSSLLFIAGIKYAGVAVATVLSSTSPMFAILLGFLFLGERVTPTQVLGSTATIAGVVVLQL